MKKSLLLYLDQKEVFDTLTDAQAGALIKAVFQYETDKTVIELDPLLKVIFIPIRQSIDRNSERYDNVCKRNSENIGKRWNKENTKNTSRKSGKKKIPNDTQNTNRDSNSDKDSNRDSNIYLSDKSQKINFKDFEEKDFIKDLEQFKEKYPKELLNNFFKYWKEKSPGGKMRFQLEKTWETELRLETWSRNSLKNGTHQQSVNGSKQAGAKQLLNSIQQDFAARGKTNIGE